MSDNVSQTQVSRKVPRWVIGASFGAAVALLVLVVNGTNSGASRESLVSQVAEKAGQHASRLGCDLTKDLRVVDAQFGTIGYDQQDHVRSAALKRRVPAVHAVVGLTCMNSTAATEDEIFQQVIFGVDTAADEPRCLGIQSITKYEVTSHRVTGYEVDLEASPDGNSVAKLRDVCDFQKS